MAELRRFPQITGMMQCGHGSWKQRAVVAVAKCIEQQRARLPSGTVEFGYLNLATPVIHPGLGHLDKHMLPRPGMLFAAKHAENAIPTALKAHDS